MRKSTAGLLAAACALCVVMSGCVERRIRVTSAPVGARVWINDQDVGTTPVETRFTFYGGYDVRVELDGYESINELREAKAPFYEYPGPDLIATALPTKLKPLIEWHFDLEQVEEATDPDGARENLLDRAQSLREQANSTSDE
ncbi:MAG: PEGA domain-containing protein [Phycisphaerales bacterium]|nr:PEGA domain-containing protein [Phycisphaerales bacterium]